MDTIFNIMEIVVMASLIVFTGTLTVLAVWIGIQLLRGKL